MGSGHMLVAAFDVLMDIYRFQGYTDRDAVRSIVENNLFGLDIDNRAAQLGYFAVMMKACEYDPRFLHRGVQPHVCAISESVSLPDPAWDRLGTDAATALALQTLFTDAKEYGSILTVDVPEAALAALRARLQGVGDDLTARALRAALLPLVDQAEIMGRTYDVVVTNPPYMGSSGMNEKLSRYVKENFPDSKADLFACCMERFTKMLKTDGFASMVTMQSWMFLSSFESLRTRFIRDYSITTLVHMENMVLGIAFGTAAVVMRNDSIKGYKGIYHQIKYNDIVNEKPKEFPVPGNRYAQVSTDNFTKIPGAPVAYWINPAVSDIFKKSPRMDSFADICIGMGTGNNDLFLREWWEVEIARIGFSIPDVESADSSGKKYFPYVKGGECRRWYGNQDKIVWYNKAGRAEMKATSGHRENGGGNRYFCRSITWSYITSGAFNARIMPTGFVFDVNGSSIFPEEANYRYIVSFLCSTVCRYLLGIINSTITTQAGNIRDLPLIISKREEVDSIGKECIDYSRIDWDTFETSWNFKKHPLI